MCASIDMKGRERKSNLLHVLRAVYTAEVSSLQYIYSDSFPRCSPSLQLALCIHPSHVHDAFQVMARQP